MEGQGRAGRQEGQGNKRLSGIACATDASFPRTCVIIDDELLAAQVVTLRDGMIDARQQVMIPLIHDPLDGKPVELDGEAVAFAAGYFFIIGSHGRPRSDKPPAEIEAGLKASSKIVRFRLDAAGAQATDLSVSTKLAALIAQETLFDPYREKELEKGGITIEGVVGDRLYAGFREPTIDKRAVILSASLGYLFDGGPAESKIFRVKLGHGRGVRDLAPYQNGILILAGPVSSESGAYSVLWWDGESDEANNLKDLPDYVSKNGKQWKPEALLPLESDNKGLRVLLLLDSAKDGKPREVSVPHPCGADGVSFVPRQRP